MSQTNNLCHLVERSVRKRKCRLEKSRVWSIATLKSHDTVVRHQVLRILHELLQGQFQLQDKAHMYCEKAT